MRKLTVTLDRFDVLWFLGLAAFWAFMGADGQEIWFLNFACMAVYWFREPLGDWLGERAAQKMREQVWKEIGR